MARFENTLATRRFHNVIVSPDHPESPGETPTYGFVEKTFHRTAWVRLRGAWAPRILTLQSEELGLGPLGISLPPRAPLPQERDRFEMEGRRVTLSRAGGRGNLLSFSLEGPGQDLGSHDWRGPMEVDTLLDHASAFSRVRKSRPGGGVQRPTPRRSPTMRERFDRAKNQSRESFTEAFWRFYWGGGEEERETLRRCCLDLVGMGEGLTPAGDDFLVGCASLSRRMACSRFRPPQPDETFRGLLSELAFRGKTTPAGEEMLYWAAKGVFLEPLRRVVSLMGDPEVPERKIVSAASPLLDVGGGSGREMLSALHQLVLHGGFVNGLSSGLQ